MYIVVNISPGSEMSLLMENLTSRMLTFSVTDDLSKLCGKCSRDCQPLPVPHQVIPEPSPPAPPKDTSPCSNSGLTSSINFSSSKKFRPAPLLTSRGQKDTESRKRLSTYDDDVSEPNPHDNSKNSLEAQISRLSQAAGHQTEFITDSIFRSIKDEPGTSTSPVSEATAAGLVSNLFKEIVENQQNDEVANLRSTKDMFRGECRLCQLPISIRTHHMRRHAMKHLGFKTYICQLCQKDFNRSDLCKSHFERYHPGKAMIPFHDTITSEQTEKLDQMIQICFPDEYRARHST